MKSKSFKIGNYKINTYIKLYTSFLIVIVAVLAILMTAYFQVLDRVQSDKKAEVQYKLEQACISVDEQISRAVRFMYNITLEDEVKKVFELERPESHNEYYRLRKVQDILRRFGPTDNLIRDCMLVYDTDSMFFIGNNYVVPDAKFFYDNGFYTYQNLSLDQWKDKIRQSDSRNSSAGIFIENTPVYLSANKATDTISYIRSFKSLGISNRAYIVLFLDSERVKSLIMPLINKREAWIRISDVYGNVIFQSPTLETDINLNKGTMLSASSTQLGLTYSVFIPDSWYESQISPVKNIILVFGSIALFLGLAISVLFAYYNGKPLLRLMGKFGKRIAGSETSSVYEFIEKNIDELFLENDAIQQKLVAWKNVMRSGLIERLLNGNVIEEKEILEATEILGAYPPNFRVVVISLDSSEESYSTAHTGMTIVAELLGKYLDPYAVHPINSKRIALILNSEESPEYYAKLIEQLTAVGEQLLSFSNITITAGIGNSYQNLDFTGVSYIEAGRALISATSWSTDRIIWYKDLRQTANGYFFPFEMMEKLKNQILSGNCDDAIELFQQVYAKNFTGTTNDSQVILQFYSDINGIILRTLGELPEKIKVDLPQPEEAVRESDATGIYHDAIRDIAFHSRSKVRAAKNNLIKDIISYINESYINPDISLKDLSDKFQLTEKYISTLFKERTGTNFSDYIESLRLKEAVQLMQKTDISINDIYLKLGYISRNTFYKAFKRKYGISPSSFRNENIGQH